MVKIKYSSDIMKYMSIFESLTGAKLKDCMVNDIVVFVVQENEMGKAIGKKGSNIKRIEGILKKKVRLVEFNNDVCRFIHNLIRPLDAKEIKEEDGIVSIYGNDVNTKSMLIVINRNKINSINEVVKMYFTVKEVKVV